MSINVKKILENIEEFNKTAEESLNEVLMEATKVEEEVEKTAEEEVEKTAEEEVEKTAEEEVEKTAEEEVEKTAEEEEVDPDLVKIAELQEQGKILARSFVEELGKIASEIDEEDFEEEALENEALEEARIEDEETQVKEAELEESRNKIINGIIENLL